MREWRIPSIVGVVLAGLGLGVNVAAANAPADSVTAALSAILITNVGLICAAVFVAGTSLQRIKVAEKALAEIKSWIGDHEEWAEKKVSELRGESGQRAQSTERRLSAYQRRDVLEPQLNAIVKTLDEIQRKLNGKQ